MAASAKTSVKFPGQIISDGHVEYIQPLPKTSITTSVSPLKALGGVTEAYGLFMYNKELEDSFENPNYSFGQRAGKIVIDSSAATASVVSGGVAIALTSIVSNPKLKGAVGGTVVITTSSAINYSKGKLYSLIGIK